MTAITQTEAFASTRYVSLGSAAAVDNMGPFWGVLYLKATAAGEGGLAYPISKCPANGQAGWRVIINDNAGAPRLVAARSSSGSGLLPERQSPNNAIVYNTWQHIIFAFEGVCDGVQTDQSTAAKVRIWIDDATEEVYAVSSDGGGTLNVDGTLELYIGNRQGGLGRAFVGKMAYASLYKGAGPSSAQISSIIANGPLTAANGVEAARLVTYVNGTVINGPQDSGNTIAIAGRSTFVDGAELPPNTALGDSAPDTTAPVLSSPTGTQTGTSTANGSVSTANDANGTLYAVCTTSSTAPTPAQVRAGQDNTGAAAAYATSQAVTAVGTQNVSATGLAASTTYYWHFHHRDAASNDSTVASSSGFTTAAPGDTTAPVLSSPTGTATGSTTASGTVSTANDANGTLYFLASTNATESAATVKAASSQAVTATGVQNVSFTSLTPSTVYYAHYLHRDAAGNDSSVSNSASFTTPTGIAPTGNFFYHHLIGECYV